MIMGRKQSTRKPGTRQKRFLWMRESMPTCGSRSARTVWVSHQSALMEAISSAIALADCTWLLDIGDRRMRIGDVRKAASDFLCKAARWNRRDGCLFRISKAEFPLTAAARDADTFVGFHQKSEGKDKTMLQGRKHPASTRLGVKAMIREDILQRFPELFGTKTINGREVHVEQAIAELARELGPAIAAALTARRALLGSPAPVREKYAWPKWDDTFEDPVTAKSRT